MNSDAWEYHLHEYAPEKNKLYMDFRRTVLDAFRSYQLPLIILDKSTTKEAVCLVFEKVNTGGMPLSVFELVTASFAADNYNLRNDWYGDLNRNISGRRDRLTQRALLKTVEPTDFLQAVSLLQTYAKRQEDILTGKTGKAASAVSAKRVTVLSLSLADYQRWANEVEAGFDFAAKFLSKEGFYHSRDLPYRTQLIPLAAVLARLKERWLEPRIYDKLSRWFWCGVLGELYGGAVETRIANDLEELIPWLESPPGLDTKIPRSIAEAAFQASRLDTLASRLSAAYKGINTLIVREGARDLFWKETIQKLDADEVGIDIHHVFPKKWCESNGIKPEAYNAILNKTPISYKANRMIGAKGPSTYLKELQNHAQVGLNEAQMNELLISHGIDSEAMRLNDYASFIERRREYLIQLLERVMGKVVDRQTQQPRMELETIVT